MPSRLSTGSSRPTATASSAEPISELAIGSSVKVRFGHAASMTSALSGLPVILPISVVGEGLGLVGVGVDELVRRDLALEELLHDVRVLVEELRGHHHVGGDVLALGPQIALVDEHLAAALLDQPGRPRLRAPRRRRCRRTRRSAASGCSPAGRC